MHSTPRAILFGSLGTLAEISGLRRRAIDVAFQEAGLAWNWTPSTYAVLAELPDLRRRIAGFAAGRGETVDVASLEARAGAIFRRMLEEVQIPLRPGVRDTIDAARALGVRLALLTGFSTEDAGLVLAATRPRLGLDTFAYVGRRGSGAFGRGSVDVGGSGAPTHLFGHTPHPSGHAQALRSLGLASDEAVAIECRPEGAAAAAAVGLPAVVVTGALHRRRAFPLAAGRAEALSPALLGLVAPQRTRSA